MRKISTEENVLLPYEKCERYGAASLTDVELLAVIIRSGTKDKNCIQVAEELFKLSGNMGILGLKHLTQRDYCSIDGIGKVKSIMFQCIGELSSRISKATMAKRTVFNTSKDVADYCMEELRHLEYECFMVLCSIPNVNLLMRKHYPWVLLIIHVLPQGKCTDTHLVKVRYILLLYTIIQAGTPPQAGRTPFVRKNSKKQENL